MMSLFNGPWEPHTSASGPRAPARRASIHGDAFAAPLRRTFSSEKELRAFAASFAQRLQPGDVVAFSGPLGSGKTTFVRAIVEALHGSDQSSSPTFTFWHRICGRTAHRAHRPLSRQRSTPSRRSWDSRKRSVTALSCWLSGGARHPELIPARGYEIDIEGAGEEPRTISLRERT